MNELTFAAPCLFGIEGVAADEFRRFGFQNVTAADGRVTFTGTLDTLAAANIRSRYTERVLLELARFPAATFTQLFDGVKAAPWEQFLPCDAAFPVDGYSVHSKLASVPDCQKIIKKAVVTAMQQKLSEQYTPERLEAACGAALKYTPRPSYKAIQTILKSGRDKPGETQLPSEPSKYGFTRGSEYYKGGRG